MPEVGPRLGQPPSDARPVMGEGGFCLYVAEQRRCARDGPAGPGTIVLRGCLALGSEALDSCKNLAGTLFDSFDGVLESPRGAEST